MTPLPPILQNSNVPYRVCKTSPLVNIRRQINPDHTLFKMHCNNVLPYILKTTMCSLPFMFMHLSALPSVPHSMPLSILLICSPSNFRCKVKIMKFLQYYFFQFPVISSLLRTNILFSTIFFNTLNPMFIL